jgi:Xaa-Pro dipeptidase
MAAAMVDGVYRDIFEALKPGARENEIVGLATKRLTDGLGLRQAINAISGERCSPASPQFHRSDHPARRSGVLRHHHVVRQLPYVLLPYLQRGPRDEAADRAYKKAREWMDEAIALIKPGVATDKIARAFPKARRSGFDTEMAAFGLSFCHGIGLGLHERPIISRLNSFDDPMELQAGMMFAVETYCRRPTGCRQPASRRKSS